MPGKLRTGATEKQRRTLALMNLATIDTLAESRELWVVGEHLYTRVPAKLRPFELWRRAGSVEDLVWEHCLGLVKRGELRFAELADGVLDLIDSCVASSRRRVSEPVRARVLGELPRVEWAFTNGIFSTEGLTFRALEEACSEQSEAGLLVDVTFGGPFKAPSDSTSILELAMTSRLIEYLSFQHLGRFSDLLPLLIYCGRLLYPHGQLEHWSWGLAVARHESTADPFLIMFLEFLLGEDRLSRTVIDANHVPRTAQGRGTQGRGAQGRGSAPRRSRAKAKVTAGAQALPGPVGGLLSAETAATKKHLSVTYLASGSTARTSEHLIRSKLAQAPRSHEIVLGELSGHRSNRFWYVVEVQPGAPDFALWESVRGEIGHWLEILARLYRFCAARGVFANCVEFTRERNQGDRLELLRMPVAHMRA